MQALSFVQSVVFGTATIVTGGLLVGDAINWRELFSLSKDGQPIEKSLGVRAIIGGLGSSLLVGGLSVLNTTPKLVTTAGLLGLYNIWAMLPQRTEATLTANQPTDVNQPSE